MRSPQHNRPILAGIAMVTLSVIGLTGCGTPGAPQPPSLKLPEPVNDLTAVRAGNSVTLGWTMPRKTTDHVPLKGPIPAAICWREGSGPCLPMVQTSQAPEAKAELQANLPTALLTGNPHATADEGVGWVERLVADLPMPKLGAYGIREEHIGDLVAKAAVASSMKANPIALTPEELAQTLRLAL